MSFFPDVPKIKFEGPDSKNPLAFRHYDENELVEGKTMRPQDAAKLGLIQGLAANKADLFRMAREWIASNPAPKQPWEERDYRMPGGAPSSPKIAAGLAVAPAMLLQKTRGLYPAAEAILETLESIPAALR